MGQEKVGTASFSVGNASHSHPVSTGWPRTHGTLRTVLTVSHPRGRRPLKRLGKNQIATAQPPGWNRVRGRALPAFAWRTALTWTHWQKLNEKITLTPVQSLNWARTQDARCVCMKLAAWAV